MTTPTLREALERCDHTLTAHGHIDANTPLHDTIRAALSSPAPDRLSERLREVNGDTPVLTLCSLLVEAATELDRLSRQPEAEPVAWQYRWNPTVSDWSNWVNVPKEIYDQLDRIVSYPFEKRALYTSPRLDREKVAATFKAAFDRAYMNAADEETAQDLAIEAGIDAIMRETR